MNYEHLRDTLQVWLNTNRPDYQEGLAVLLSYGDKPLLCKQLAEYNNPQKLYDSLLKLYNQAKEKAANTLPNKKEVRELIREAVNTNEPVIKDKVVLSINAKLRDKIKEIDSLKGILFSIGREGMNLLRIKTLTDVRKEMLTGQPFSITYCKYSKKRSTGGERISIQNALLFANSEEQQQLEAITKIIDNPRAVKRNPHHSIHNTFNIRLNNGNTEKVRWLFIEDFNNYKVVM